MQRHIKLSPKQRIAALCGFSTLAAAGLIGGIYSLRAFASAEDEVLIYLPNASVQEFSNSQATSWEATYHVDNQDISLEFNSGSPFNYVADGTSYLNPTTYNNAYAPGQFINFSSNADITQYNIYLRERVDEAPKLIDIHCNYTMRQPNIAKAALGVPTIQTPTQQSRPATLTNSSLSARLIQAIILLPSPQSHLVMIISLPLSPLGKIVELSVSQVHSRMTANIHHISLSHS